MLPDAASPDYRRWQRSIASGALMSAAATRIGNNFVALPSPKAKPPPQIGQAFPLGRRGDWLLRPGGDRTQARWVPPLSFNMGEEERPPHAMFVSPRARRRPTLVLIGSITTRASLISKLAQTLVWPLHRWCMYAERGLLKDVCSNHESAGLGSPTQAQRFLAFLYGVRCRVAALGGCLVRWRACQDGACSRPRRRGGRIAVRSLLTAPPAAQTAA
jgi:hypothetical protein